MSSINSFRHAASHVLLRTSLLLGGGFYVLVAGLLLITPETVEGYLGLTSSIPTILFQGLALFLLLAAAYQALPAYDFVAYSGNIAVAILGRFLVAGLLGWTAWNQPDFNGLGAVAALEFFLGLMYTVLWIPFRRSPIV